MKNFQLLLTLENEISSKVLFKTQGDVLKRLISNTPKFIIIFCKGNEGVSLFYFFTQVKNSVYYKEKSSHRIKGHEIKCS